jgi:hypothetical protein
VRHIVIASVSAVLVYAFYLSYGAWGVEPALWPAWDQDHPLWRAFAHTAYVLLVAALAIGPAARLWRPAARALPWRRELGIWFALRSSNRAARLLGTGWPWVHGSLAQVPTYWSYAGCRTRS